MNVELFVYSTITFGFMSGFVLLIAAALCDLTQQSCKVLQSFAQSKLCMPVVVTSCLLLTWIGGATLYRLPYKEVYARSKMPMSSHPGVGERTFANRCWPCHRSYSNWPKLAKKIKGGSLSFNMEGIVRSIERGKLDERGNPKIREQLVAFLLSQPQ